MNYYKEVESTKLDYKGMLEEEKLKGKIRSYDYLPSSLKYDDVSFTLLKATYKKETGMELYMPRDLISLGLMTQD